MFFLGILLIAIAVPKTSKIQWYPAAKNFNMTFHANKAGIYKNGK